MKRKRYTAAFKQKAVQRASKEGATVVAKELKLADSLLYSWKKAQNGSSTPIDHHGAIIYLRKSLQASDKEIARALVVLALAALEGKT